MGAGSYVGRVGGLAVALGIGAAVFVGAGVAVADDDTSSAGDSTSQTSSAGEQAGEGSSTATAADSDANENDANENDADASDADENDLGEDLDDADVDDEPVVDEPVDAADERDVDVERDYSSTIGDADEPAAEPDGEQADGPEVTLAVADEELADPAPVAAPVAVVEPEVAEFQLTEPDVPEKQQIPEADVVATAVPDSAAVDELAGGDDDPIVPALASMMMSLVTAAREVTQDDEPPGAAADAGTSLVDDAYPIPTGVEVTKWTAPLKWTQRIPVLGRFVVTPLVGVMHLIPFVGDILHRVFGFPIDHDAPPGTPAAQTYRVTSFDGTKIFVNFMPATGLQAGESAPTVLDGPGLGIPGSTALNLKVDGLLSNDVIGIGTLRDAGYNVVTWDPRGEWFSQGRMQLDSPDYEGRDISHVISWLATMPGVALDAPNDPAIGMVGASYGGGIQLATAAVDHRVDAIVPTIAWNSLTDVLFPDQAVRSGWATLLSSVLVLTLARPNERILPAAIRGIIAGKVSQDDIDLLNDRGYADQLDDITAPTLLIQGTVDTLFTLAQADINARALLDAGTTTKVIWYCGGHGACLSTQRDGSVNIEETLNWLDRYVKGDTTVDTGPQFEWVDQNGQWYSSDSYPAPEDMTPVTAGRTDDKSLLYIPFFGGSGPSLRILTAGPLQTLLGLPSGAWAFNAVNLNLEATEATQIVGTPELTLTYSGRGNAEHVYAQIVDNTTGLVLGNQVTPIPVTLDGQTHTITFPMEQVAHTLEPGQHLTVQIVTSAFPFLNFYSWGAITVDEMSISLPTLGAAVGSVAGAA